MRGKDMMIFGAMLVLAWLLYQPKPGPAALSIMTLRDTG